LGHYARKFPNKKKKKKKLGGITVIVEKEEFSVQFEREFSLIVCCLTTEMPSNIWYVDSGASSSMLGVRGHFSDLKDPEIKVEIMLGVDTIVKVVRCDTLSFQGECMPPVVFRDVLYVPWLRRNLISVSSIQDKGIEVSFIGIEVLIHLKGSNVTSDRVVGTREGNLYMLLFQSLHALMSRSNNNQLCELWHRRMAHLHHGALRLLRDIVMGMP
jgi:hypothetical protein